MYNFYVYEEGCNALESLKKAKKEFDTINTKSSLIAVSQKDIGFAIREKQRALTDVLPILMQAQSDFDRYLKFAVKETYEMPRPFTENQAIDLLKTCVTVLEVGNYNMENFNMIVKTMNEIGDLLWELTQQIELSLCHLYKERPKKKRKKSSFPKEINREQSIRLFNFITRTVPKLSACYDFDKDRTFDQKEVSGQELYKMIISSIEGCDY